MIIRSPPKLTNRSSIVTYIEVYLWSWMKDLATNLFAINFKDNFISFTVTDLLIPAGKEVAINNQFNSTLPGTIPNSRIITRQTGNALIIDGPTEWTKTSVYLYNPSGNDATVNVIFFI